MISQVLDCKIKNCLDNFAVFDRNIIQILIQIISNVWHISNSIWIFLYHYWKIILIILWIIYF